MTIEHEKAAARNDYHMMSLAVALTLKDLDEANDAVRDAYERRQAARWQLQDQIKRQDEALFRCHELGIDP